MSYEFPEDWYEDIDGRSRMLSYEKVGAEIARLRAALLMCRDMVGHPDNIAAIDAVLNQQDRKDT